ncbi:MAG: pyridoxal phosphate-dependent aminotransferase [Vicinamibacterales bacterium]
MSRIQTSPTLQVAAAALRLKEQGVDVVDLGAGEPDFPTPAHIAAAGRRAIDEGRTKYTANTGTTALRRAIARRYEADYGVSYAEQEIIVSAGGKQALVNAMLALFGPGDEVVTHAPGWPSIPEQITLADATPVAVRCHSEDGFAIRAEPILDALTPRTKGIVLNSPCNPTGAVMAESEVALVAAEAARRGLWIVVDLCYERLIYDATPHNLLAVLTKVNRDRTIFCGSASKAYAMTGWRCGWALGPAEAIAACAAVQSHSTSNVCSITQEAAIAALEGPQTCVQEMLDEYRRRRDRVWTLMTADPRVKCLKPGGAFYLLLDIGELLSPGDLRTSADFARALLAELNVAVTPGEAFDAPGCIRISYATSVERLEEGARRLHAFIGQRDAARREAVPSAR